MGKKKAMEPLTEEEKKIVEDHIGLAVSLAEKMQHCRLPLRDRVQAGVLGLIEAVKTLNHTLGATISTHSYLFIKQAIYRAESYNQVVYVPTRMRFKCEWGDPAKQARYDRLLSCVANLKEIKLMAPSQLTGIVSQGDAEPTRAEDDAGTAFLSLPGHLQDVVRHRVWGDDTLTDVAKALGCARQTVLTREAKAFKILRERLSEYAEAS